MENIYTLSNTTYATNPGNAKLKPLIWLIHTPGRPLFLLFGLTLTAILSFFLSYFFISFFLYALYKNWFYWRRRKEHFLHGDSNPGIIISTSPMLVAIATDLTKGNGHYPVIKIIPYKGNGKTGERIATVALYGEYVKQKLPHWVYFEPVPLNYATNNDVELNRALNSYSYEQWDSILNGLEQIPRPFSVGMYKVQNDSSDWVN